MHLAKSISIFAVLNLHYTTAIPTRPSPPTACTTVSPTIAHIDALHPTEAYIQGVQISQEAHGTNKQDMLAEFTVPPGVWGCTLSYSFPAGNHVSNTAEGNWAAPVEVFSVNGPLSRSEGGIVDVTWDDAPEPVRQVGSVQFQSDERGEVNRAINSFACEENMSYRFSISEGYEKEAKVGFEQGDGVGLMMTYNC
ncbi:hypothetical protein BDV18DRAFT_141974 [Aspergillus unguis]